MAELYTKNIKTKQRKKIITLKFNMKILKAK